MSYLWQTSKQLAAADDNGIAEAQSPGAGAITLDGDLVVDGVAVLDTARQVIVTSDDDESGITFTITGTTYSGAEISETITGPDTAAAATTQSFLTVTSVTHSGTVTGEIIVGTNGVGTSNIYVPEPNVTPAQYGLQATIDGTANYTVEFTLDDPNAPFSGTFPTWFPITTPDFDAESTNKAGNFEMPITALRLKINSGTDEVKLIVRQAGLITR